MLAGVEEVLGDPAPLVLVDALSPSTVDLRLLFWTDARQATVRRTRDAVLRAAVEAYDAAGIELPYDVVQLEAGVSVDRVLRREPG